MAFLQKLPEPATCAELASPTNSRSAFDAGEHTPQLSKLLEEGVLTPEEYIQLRKGAPIVMGGVTDTQIQMRITWQARDTEVNAGVDSLISGSIDEVSFDFTDTDNENAPTSDRLALSPT